VKGDKEPVEVETTATGDLKQELIGREELYSQQ